MSTQSFYIPDSEESSLMRSLNRTAKERDLSVSQLLIEILKGYFQITERGDPKSTGWATSFCGAWKENLKTKALIKTIENKRSRYQPATMK